MIEKIYFAAPLFNPMEFAYNQRCVRKLEEAGFSVFLPQRDAGELAEGNIDPYQVFVADIEGIDYADAVVAVLSGRVPDEGTCWECGYAYAKNKPVIALFNDKRSFMNGNLNNMLEYGARFMYGNIEDVIKRLKGWYT